MENNITYEYPRGIWCIDEDAPNMALKISGNKTIRIPQTKEILEEIKKQIDASKLFRAFKKVNPEDENIIGYLNLILEDCINYLDLDSLNTLTNRMKQIETANNLEPQNVNFIQQLRVNLETRMSLEINGQEKSENLESFYDIFDQFQAYNESYANANVSIPKAH